MNRKLAEGINLDSVHLPRRTFLQVGGLGALGLTLPSLLRAQQSGDHAGTGPTGHSAKSCILVFLAGGPSQFETFDPKPEAPQENRTIFQTIRSSVPGTLMCEMLPLLAQQAKQFALVRSVHHVYPGHLGGYRYALTGHSAPGNSEQAARPDDKPGIIALANKYLSGRNQMPGSVMAPWAATDQGSVGGGMAAATLGRRFDPVRVEVDQATADRSPVFRIPEFALQPGVSAGRLERRQQLLSVVEGQRRQLLEEASQEMDPIYQNAYDLLTSSRIREGFSIEGESTSLRNRYGMNAVGQSCLLARRLIERGSRFVQVNFARSVAQPGFGWDTHFGARPVLQNQLLPRLDASVATLLDDLSVRGMLKETLVVVMGEFGRTPAARRDGGRDHWQYCYSVMMAGGGVHGGLVYGASDRTGARPASNPVEAREILVTIMTLLGIPTMVTDPQGRAVPLFEGVHPVRALYA